MKLVALKATAVGASLTFVTEMVKASVLVLSPVSVAVREIEYELFASKSPDTESFNLRVLPTNSKESASVPVIE